ncbi:MAG: DNA replication and repair protein RecF [Candidatus Berkelbacteria bacterium]|nr:DNA replication and repair protein RecF [Candidatus Berkelbacteria bacterium]
MIQSIRLKNIRRFKDQKFEFAPKVNLIVGPNGSGKTTILESIAFFSFGKFQSVEHDSFVIGGAGEIGRLEAFLEKKAEISAEVAILQKQKIVKIFDKKVPNSQVVGLLKTVFFNPKTVEIVGGPPQIRRREIDMVLAQKDPDFVKTLLHYRMVLRERNMLLKAIFQKKSALSELDFWNEKLVKYALEIYEARIGLIDFINQDIAATYEKLLSSGTNLTLEYLPSANYERLSEQLIATQDEDIKFGVSSIGPHRDDILFKNSKLVLKEGGSRGEQRMAAISFKAETKKFLKQTGEVILILDDVFSELDHKRRESVLNVLDIIDHAQVFISATDEKVIPEKLIQSAKVIRL